MILHLFSCARTGKWCTGEPLPLAPFGPVWPGIAYDNTAITYWYPFWLPAWTCLPFYALACSGSWPLAGPLIPEIKGYCNQKGEITPWARTLHSFFCKAKPQFISQQDCSGLSHEGMTGHPPNLTPPWAQSFALDPHAYQPCNLPLWSAKPSSHGD